MNENMIVTFLKNLKHLRCKQFMKPLTVTSQHQLSYHDRAAGGILLWVCSQQFMFIVRSSALQSFLQKYILLKENQRSQLLWQLCFIDIYFIIFSIQRHDFIVQCSFIDYNRWSQHRVTHLLRYATRTVLYLYWSYPNIWILYIGVDKLLKLYKSCQTCSKTFPIRLFNSQ